jgi:hypothetical protein
MANRRICKQCERYSYPLSVKHWVRDPQMDRAKQEIDRFIADSKGIENVWECLKSDSRYIINNNTDVTGIEDCPYELEHQASERERYELKQKRMSTLQKSA